MPSPKPKTKTRGQTSRDYCAIARKYAEDVVSGAIPACKWVRLACQRQLDDLQRPRGEDWPYHFDRKRAARVCQFIELLPHIKGKWKTANLTLEPWQIFILTTVFGWINDAGERRFRKGYVEVPRKNAKSTLSAGVGLYLLAADDEPGAEVYSAATNREQAHAVWEVAKRMAARTEGLRRRFGVETHAHSITVESNASAFKALSADANSLDGLNIHGAVVDELHAHKTRAVHDVLDSATGSRSQPLIWQITTAGFNRSGVCYEQRTYVTKVLERVHADERYFGVIYTVDEGDDWTVAETHRKANPNYGVSVLEADMAAMCRQAMLSAQSQNNFLTKRLNVWVNADTAWMNMQAWDACKDTTLRIEDFEGQPCAIGLDLAAKIDVAAKVRLFWRDLDSGRHYYCFGTYYLPEEVVEQGVNTNCSHYAGWNREFPERFILTDGASIDQDRIQDEVLEDCKRFDVQAIPFDKWNATQLSQHLLAEGAPMVEFGMNAKMFSEPMRTLEALVADKRFHHDGDPTLAWMMSNVVARPDANENLFPRKERPENKIDGPVALLMALGMAMRNQPQFVDPSFAVI